MYFNIEIEIIKKYNKNILYIANDGSSGCEYTFKTKEELADLIKGYIDDLVKFEVDLHDMKKTPDLPDEITLSIEDDLGLTDIDDEKAVNEEIANYIDEHYPVSADGWEWEVGDDCSEIVVYDIQWNEE